MQAINSFGRMPMYNQQQMLQRAQSLNMLPGYGRPPPHMLGAPGFNGGVPHPGAMMYPRPPPGAPLMPFAYSQAAPPPPRPAATSPMWESAHASRSHIVFQGDSTVFCVKLAGPKDPN